MNWITELIWGNGIAHTILLLAFVIAVGIALGKIKVAGISLGIAMVLFSGIAFAHFGFRGNEPALAFIKEFGLILFVYAIGLQVGPGFFASLKKGGVLLNLFALGIVMFGVITTLVIYYFTDLPISTLVGILSGAVTNTPGLGAAQEAYASMNAGKAGPDIGLGYAVAYPFGVTGIICSIIVLRIIFRVNFAKEKEKIEDESIKKEQPSIISMEVRNPAIFGKNIETVTNLINREFVISRIMHSGKAETASSESVLNEGDKVIVVAAPVDVESISVFIGRQINMSIDDWNKQGSDLLSRRILITRPEINGKPLLQLNLRHRFGVNVTRVNRSGIDLVAHPDLKLAVGDLVTVVGTGHAIAGAEKVLGNEMKRLNEPNLIPVFVGISLGVLVGSIPFSFPGIPQPVRLGLAGGPLIVAILMGYFGTRSTLVTYTTLSANLMVREIGICLFLACVGLDAGKNFAATIVSMGGLSWIGFAVIIAVVPLILAGIIARYFFHINYFTLMGLLAGSTTDPPALSYATYTADNDHPTVGYASVYPLTMFLRVMSAQLLILLFS